MSSIIYWISLALAFILGAVLWQFVRDPLSRSRTGAAFRSANAPAWTTAIAAIVAVFISSYFSYKANQVQMLQFEFEAKPGLGFTCGDNDISQSVLNVELFPPVVFPGHMAGPEPVWPQWLSNGNFTVCDIQNFGHSTVLDVNLNYSFSYCNKYKGRAYEVIPAIPAGGTTKILLANMDQHNDVDISFDRETAATVPPGYRERSDLFPNPGSANSGDVMQWTVSPAGPIIEPGFSRPLPIGENVCSPKFKGLKSFFPTSLEKVGSPRPRAH